MSSQIPISGESPISATQEIDEQIAGLADWRGTMLAKARMLIVGADENVTEEIKWRKPSNPGGVPVWSHGGIICTGEIYKDKVKLTFAQGAALPDPAKLFNASLDGNSRRAIDLFEGDQLDEGAFTTLIRAAIQANHAQKAKS